MSDLQLNEDGTVTATVAGATHTLRRPLLGEYRKLRELLHTKSNQGRERQRAFIEKAAEAAEAAKGSDEPAPDSGWFDPSVEVEEWVLEAFTMLGAPTIAGDQLPAWAADPDLPNQLLGHWRAVPLGRGPQQAVANLMAGR